MDRFLQITIPEIPMHPGVHLTLHQERCGVPGDREQARHTRSHIASLRCHEVQSQQHPGVLYPEEQDSDSNLPTWEDSGKRQGLRTAPGTWCGSWLSFRPPGQSRQGTQGTLEGCPEQDPVTLEEESGRTAQRALPRCQPGLRLPVPSPRDRNRRLTQRAGSTSLSPCQPG